MSFFALGAPRQLRGHTDGRLAPLHAAGRLPGRAGVRSSREHGPLCQLRGQADGLLFFHVLQYSTKSKQEHFFGFKKGWLFLDRYVDSQAAAAVH